MTPRIDANALSDAFDRIARRALDNGARLELFVYGGSALAMASNFRFSTEDVDIAPVPGGEPEWLTRERLAIAKQNEWPDDWLNDAVAFHLSKVATPNADHVILGDYPRGPGPYGLSVYIPTAEYLLALKLKALRILDPTKGATEAADIRNLSKVVGAETIDQKIAVLRRHFPVSASSPEKLRFLIKHLESLGVAHHAPEYPRTGPTSDSGRKDDGRSF